MKNTSIVKILIFLYFVEFLRTEWTFNERPYTFSCIYSKDKLVSIVWQNQAPRTLFACQYNMIPTCIPAEDKGSVEYAANMTVNSLSYISVFTIKHVSLSHHNTTWSCQANFGQMQRNSTTFYLDVFAIAKSPTCKEVTVDGDINIQIHCLTETVFPAAICEFYVNTNTTGDVKLTTGSIDYNNTQSSTIGYNKTKCSYTVPAADLGPGSHVFNVVMYPNITSNITEEMKTKSQNRNPEIIGCPQAELQADCFVYIHVIENRTCTCSDVSQNILPPKITWSAGNETMKFITSGQLVKNISVFEGTSFTCTITNALNCTKQIHYILKRYYELPQKENEVKSIALGAGIGAGLLLCVISFIACFVFQNTDACVMKTNSSGRYEQLIDNSVLYYGQDKLSPNFDRHQDYKDLIPTIKSASEPPKNFKHIAATFSNNEES